jgi:tRNA acetyltransferase TAN1
LDQDIRSISKIQTYTSWSRFTQYVNSIPLLMLFFTYLAQSICGISVVPNDYEALKRYNLAEIFEPSPKEQPKKKIEAPKEQPADIINEKPDEKLETPVAKEEIEVPTVAEETETSAPAVGDEVAQV